MVMTSEYLSDKSNSIDSELGGWELRQSIENH